MVIYLYKSETWRLTGDPNISYGAKFLEFRSNIVSWQELYNKVIISYREKTCIVI